MGKLQKFRNVSLKKNVILGWEYVTPGLVPAIRSAAFHFFKTVTFKSLSITSLPNLHNIFLSEVFHAVLFQVFRAFWEVDVGFVLLVMLNVFQVDEHVQGIGQHQQQDEGGDEAHQDGWRQEGGTVARRRKLSWGDAEGLNLRRA